jgi:hypothetical protein
LLATDNVVSLEVVDREDDEVEEEEVSVVTGSDSALEGGVGC